MTHDEVIQLARQAWAETGEGWAADAWFFDRAESFERFAALVAAAEREACAADCDAAADRLAACPASPENRAAVSALRYRAQAIRANSKIDIVKGGAE